MHAGGQIRAANVVVARGCDRSGHRVLEAHGGSRTLAARTLGLDRKTLYRKLKAYEGGHDGHEELAAQNRIDPHADS